MSNQNMEELLENYEQIVDTEKLHKIIKFLIDKLKEFGLITERPAESISKNPSRQHIEKRFQRNESGLTINDFFDKDIEDYIKKIKHSTIETGRRPIEKVRNKSYNFTRSFVNSKTTDQKASETQGKIQNDPEKEHTLYKHGQSRSLYMKKRGNNPLLKNPAVGLRKRKGSICKSSSPNKENKAQNTEVKIEKKITIKRSPIRINQTPTALTRIQVNNKKKEITKIPYKKFITKRDMSNSPLVKKKFSSKLSETIRKNK